jgi:hypothetical protein
MTSAKQLEKRLTACLRQAENTQKTAARLMEHIRLLIKLTEDENEKAAYQRQLRYLQSVVHSCKSEAKSLGELIRKVRGDAPKSPKNLPPPPPPPPPPHPTTIRVYVPKGVYVPDDVIKQIVLQKLNGYAKETEA